MMFQKVLFSAFEIFDRDLKFLIENQSSVEIARAVCQDMVMIVKIFGLTFFHAI